MKKNSRLRSRRDAYIRYFGRVENSRVRSGWKKAVFILLPVFCILSFIYWYVMIAGAPQLDRPEAIALHAPYDGKIPATNAIAQDTPLSYQIQTYNSKVMRGERTYGICLPPSYAQNTQQRYPVLFLLHGGNGNPTDWFEKGVALPVLEQLYAMGKLPPSIIITPDGNDRRGQSPFFDPQYINGANGRVNTAIGDELVKVVQSRYRTLPTPNFWAMGGLSSGGWGALNIGLHHLKHFSILFSHSGYFRDRSGAENSPIIYIKKIPKAARSRLRIYLDAGEQDGKFLEESKKFAQVLTQLKIPHVFYKFPGGHGIVGADTGWNYWHKHLADSLTYVGQQFDQASSIAPKKVP